MSRDEAVGRGLRPARAVLYGAAAVGALDFAYASLFVSYLGRPWYRAWQGVAAAVLGPSSFEGGYGTAFLGIVLHFTVSACIVSTYWVLSRWIPVMRRRVVLPGLLFGAAAFFVMNLVVVPLTRIGRQPLVWSAFQVGALLLHAFLLGPAAAYFVGCIRPRDA
jgi:hypothetical protein